MASSSNNQIVLLLDRGADFSEFGKWLSDNGFVAWRANDVRHAIEELSDFTVRRRPDVVMLEVARLQQRFDALTKVFHKCSDDVSVCGYGPAATSTGLRLASDLDQLKSMISHQVQPSNN